MTIPRIISQQPNPLLLAALLFTLFCLPNAFAAEATNHKRAVAQAVTIDKTLRFRKTFKDAIAQINRNELTLSKKTIAKLDGYILQPFAQQHLINANQSIKNIAKLKTFISQNQGTWAAEKARERLLNLLVIYKKHPDFIQRHNKEKASSARKCQYIQALQATKSKINVQPLIEDVWLTGRSQTKTCNPIFKRWKSTAKFNDELVWQRFMLARKARQYGLSRYLSKMVKNPAIKQRIQLYHRLRVKPSLALNAKNFDLAKAKTNKHPELIQYGLNRIASEQPNKAYAAYVSYQQKQIFNFKQRQSITQSAIKGWSKEKNDTKAFAIAKKNTKLLTPELYSWQLRELLKAQNWADIIRWHGLLPQKIQSEPMWQYWFARATQAKEDMDKTPEDAQSSIPQQTFEKLLKQRSYYSNLASLILEKPFTLNNHSPQISDADLSRVKAIPAIAEAIELTNVGYSNNSRNAWAWALDSLDKSLLDVAAKLADNHGMYYNAAISVAKAENWDFLDARFPVVYKEDFLKCKAKFDLNIAWPMSIARQESNFATDLKSPANARGLMQIVPATAKQIAKKYKIKYSTNKLYQPSYNIPLGCGYLKHGLELLDGNIVYATAGYNAGVHRAKKWLKDGRDLLPLDAWIDSIPFDETRKYVKNVMNYSVFYSTKFGTTTPLKLLQPRMFTAKKAETEKNND